MSTKIFAALATTASLASLLSCSSGVECGSGTIEKDGECVADGNGVVPGGNCGAGSIYDPETHTCVGNFCEGADCGICGSGTELQFVDGVATCVGTGAVTDCNAAILCPPPAGEKFMACGRVYDSGTTEEVRKVLRLGFFDALKFAMQPELPPEISILTDTCGRFASTDGGAHIGVTIPAAAPFVVIGVDDNTGTDDYILTGAGIEVSAGSQQQGVRAYATAKTTATAWGNNLVTKGAMLAIFIDTSKPKVGPFPGTPAAGITLTIDGATNATKDFYFTDSATLTRGTVGGDETGANGSALFSEGELVPYGGTPDVGACKWPQTVPGATLPGTVFVAERCCGADEGTAKCY